jgi:hypothetical protein
MATLPSTVSPAGKYQPIKSIPYTTDSSPFPPTPKSIRDISAPHEILETKFFFEKCSVLLHEM